MFEQIQGSGVLGRRPPILGPGGADGCSHGWSSPEANGTRGTVTPRPSRPGGAEDDPHCHSPLSRTRSAHRAPHHGPAKTSAGHEQSIAPPGRKPQKRLISTGSASRCAGTRHPWLQPLTPSGSTAVTDDRLSRGYSAIAGQVIQVGGTSAPVVWASEEGNRE